MFVFSAMATKVKVTKSMLNTLDYQNTEAGDNAVSTKYHLSAG